MRGLGISHKNHRRSQILTAQKIHELRTLYGISDPSDKLIKQHIISIFNFDEYWATVNRVLCVLRHMLVYEFQLSAGIKDILINKHRRFYQALLFAERGRVDYRGMDGPLRKRRKKVKKGPNAIKIPNERSCQEDSDVASPGQTQKPK